MSIPNITNIVIYVFGIIASMLFFAFGITSIHEHEKRATIISFLLTIFSLGGFHLITLLHPWIKFAILLLMLLTALVVGISLILPEQIRHAAVVKPSKRFDERDIMFARARLELGSSNFNAYYDMKPENLAADELTRTKPGLFSNQSLFANPPLFAAADASFFLTENLSDAVDGPINPIRQTFTTNCITEFIKELTLYYGALSVGIAKLQPYHVYSNIGRGSGEYGAPLEVEHEFAIAFTVEMDHGIVGTYPLPQGSMETAKQYVEAARTAVQLAAFIRNIGYPARAHIDGNYRVIAPLVARDANLGEIGRMGLLMTPKQGPRVRIGVVTTNLELNPDEYLPDQSLIDFCNLCKKCAENCPSNSIMYDRKTLIDGVKRWQINSDTCFRYWNVAGTDCGVCVRTCPYSHPDNIFHNAIRLAIRKGKIYRILIYQIDKLFYGKHPSKRPAPEWMNTFLKDK